MQQVDSLSSYRAKLTSICVAYDLAHPINDVNLHIIFQEKIGHLRDKTQYSFNINGEIDYQKEDIISLITELRHSVSNVIFYHEEGLSQPRAHFTFSPTQNDMLFFYFVDDSFMRLYNIWNRMANLINWFFKLVNEEANVYFINIIDKLGKVAIEDESYKRLLEYRDNEYRETLNKRRKGIVHRATSWNTYYKHLVERCSASEKIEDLILERDALPPFLISSYSRLIGGVYEMLDVIRNNIKTEE
jgi:hypothetical protein